MKIDYDRGIPIYRQIYESVLAALASGKLTTEEQLPTIHQLAKQLEINPNTVARAYKDLERDGYIVAHRGLGTFPDPSKKVVPTSPRRDILKAIYHQAMAEGARHGIRAKEILRYFRSKSHDS